MRLNIPLLRKTMEHIEAHPEEHDQHAWRCKSSCGTTYCFAGWAAILAGAKFVSDSTVMAPGDPEVYDVDHFAQEQLGLTTEQAGDLFFDFTEDVSRLRKIVDEFIDTAEAAEALAVS